MSRRPGAAPAPFAMSLLLATAVAVACGYAWEGAHGAGGLGRVAVQTPENDSRQGGLELVVADALRREVLRRSGAQLVEDPGRADWVVSGRVHPLRSAPASLSPLVLTLEYELTLQVALRARSPDGRELEVDARALRETERYLSSADVEAQRKNRDEALRRLSRVLAARFLDLLDEDRRREEGT